MIDIDLNDFSGGPNWLSLEGNQARRSAIRAKYRPDRKRNPVKPDTMDRLKQAVETAKEHELRVSGWNAHRARHALATRSHEMAVEWNAHRARHRTPLTLPEPTTPKEAEQLRAWGKAIRIIDGSEAMVRDLIERKLAPVTPPARFVSVSHANAAVTALSQKVQNLRAHTIKTAFRMLRRTLGDKRIKDLTLASWAKFLAASDATNIDMTLRSGLANRVEAPEIARRVVGSLALNGTDGITQITRTKIIHLARASLKSRKTG